MAFLASFVKYLIEMIILAAIGVAGALVGIKLRKNKNAKEEAKVVADVEATEKSE